MSNEELIEYYESVEPQFKKYFAKYRYNYGHEYDDIKQNTLVSLIIKNNEGKIDTDDLTRLKGYMFTTFRNNLLKVYKESLKQVRLVYTDEGEAANLLIKESLENEYISLLDEQESDIRNLLLEKMTEEELEFCIDYVWHRSKRNKPKYSHFKVRKFRALKYRVLNPNKPKHYWTMVDGELMSFTTKKELLKAFGITNPSNSYFRIKQIDDTEYMLTWEGHSHRVVYR